MREQQPAGGGELDLAAVAVEQLGAEVALQQADLLRQRRLRDVEALRRPAEVQLLGDHDERAEAAKVDH